MWWITDNCVDYCEVQVKLHQTDGSGPRRYMDTYLVYLILGWIQCNIQSDAGRRGGRWAGVCRGWGGGGRGERLYVWVDGSGGGREGWLEEEARGE